MIRPMLVMTTALTLLTGIAGTALAQDGDRSTLKAGMMRDCPMMHRGYGEACGALMTPDQIASTVNQRLTALRTALRLNTEQEKLWPPVEAALRDTMQQRMARKIERKMQMDGASRSTDLVNRLRWRADVMAERAAATKRIAETIDPLYRMLDKDQKDRLAAMLPGGFDDDLMRDGRRADRYDRYDRRERYDDGGRYRDDDRRGQRRERYEDRRGADRDRDDRRYRDDRDGFRQRGDGDRRDYGRRDWDRRDRDDYGPRRDPDRL